MLKKFVVTLADFLGLSSELKENGPKAFSIAFPSGVDVKIFNDVEGSVFFYSDLGDTNIKSEDSKLLLRLMIGNLFGRETGGASLGLDETGKIVFVKKLYKAISYDHFKDAFEIFINFSEAWQEELASYDTDNKKS